MMVLVRTFTLLAMCHNIHVKIKHIAGVKNDVADALSCFEMDRFWQLCPGAVPESLTPITIW